MIIASIILQYLVSSGTISYLAETSTGAYSAYASRNSWTDIFTNYSVSNLPQLLLFIVMIFFRTKIDAKMYISNNEDKERLDILRLMCYFDFFLVPVITTLSIYRGYEYFYLARLIMWGEIIPIIRNYFSKESQNILSFGFWIFFTVWMYSRIEATYESSHLMPYIFDLL